jgi:hypothetical protein
MSNAAKKTDALYTVLDTHRVPDARREALTFSACLAADKGYSSRIVRVTGGWDVVASDNRAIRFLSRAKTL